MADDDSSKPKTPADFVSQLSAMTARLWGMNGSFADSMPSNLTMPSVPQIGSLSAAQFKAMTTTVHAQRQSIQALQTQLQAFDEHLAALLEILEPLQEWSQSWAALERSATLHPAAPDPK